MKEIRLGVLKHSEVTIMDDKKIIKPKLGLLELEKLLKNMSLMCKAKGYTRDMFHQFKELYESGGEEALYQISKRKSLSTNKISEDVEKAVIKMAVEFPMYGQKSAARELKKEGFQYLLVK